MLTSSHSILNLPKTLEGPNGKTGNVHFGDFFGYYPFCIDEIMKFSTIKSDAMEKTGRVLKNQLLKDPTEY